MFSITKTFSQFKNEDTAVEKTKSPSKRNKTTTDPVTENSVTEDSVTEDRAIVPPVTEDPVSTSIDGADTNIGPDHEKDDAEVDADVPVEDNVASGSAVTTTEQGDEPETDIPDESAAQDDTTAHPEFTRDSSEQQRFSAYKRKLEASMSRERALKNAKSLDVIGSFPTHPRNEFGPMTLCDMPVQGSQVGCDLERHAHGRVTSGGHQESSHGSDHGWSGSHMY